MVLAVGASQDIAIRQRMPSRCCARRTGSAVGARIALYRAALRRTCGSGDQRRRPARLADGQPDPGALYLPMIPHLVEGAGAREHTAAPASLRDASGCRSRLSRASPRAGNPGLRLPLHKFADQLTQALNKTLPHRHGLQRGPPGHRAGHGGARRDHRGRAHQAAGSRRSSASGTRSGRSVPADLLEPRLILRVAAAGPVCAHCTAPRGSSC